MIKNISRVLDGQKEPHILASWHCPDPSVHGVYPGRTWEVSGETQYSLSPALTTTDFDLIGIQVPEALAPNKAWRGSCLTSTKVDALPG